MIFHQKESLTKRIHRFFLFICVFMSALTLTVLAESGDLTLESQYLAMTTDGDTVYLLDKEQQLFVFEAGSEVPDVPVCAVACSASFLMIDEGRLYGWDTASGALFCIDSSTGSILNERILRTADLLLDDGYYHTFRTPVLQKGVLTTVISSQQNLLVQYGVDNTRTTYTIDTDDAFLIDDSKGGILLAASKQNEMQLYRVDVKGKLERLRDLPSNTWAMVVRGETMYICTSNRILQYNGLNAKEGTPAAYLTRTPLEMQSQPAMLLNNDAIALLNEQTLYLRNLDINRTVRILTLNDPFYNNPEINASFLSEHPDVVLNFVESYPTTGEEFHRELAQSDIDILWCEPRYSPWNDIKQKGYAMDLSQSSLLQETVESMYPGLRDAFMQDGKAMAIPFEYHIGGALEVYMPLFEQASVPKDMMPQTLLELPDFLTLWADVYMDEHPDIAVLGEYAGQKLFSAFLEQYATAFQSQGLPLTFDTALFRAGIAMKDQTPDFEAKDEPGIMWAISSTENIQIDCKEEPRIMALPLDLAHPYVLPLTPRILFVNPNSQNADLAIAYLENAIRCMSPQMRALFMPGDGQPVLNPDYEDILQEYHGYIAEIEEELKQSDQSDEKERGRLEALLVEQQNSYDEIAESERWLVSPEFLSAYHSLTAHMWVVTEGFFAWDENQPDRSSGIRALCERFYQNQISADAFIEGLQRIADIQAMEQ